MRRSNLLLLLPIVAATPLTAQFEGTVKMRMSAANDGKLGDVVVAVKGPRMLYTMQSPMMPGTEMHMLIDGTTQKVSIMIPLEGEMAGAMSAMPGMADAKGLLMVQDMNATAPGGNKEPDPVFKDLGTSQTLAGYKCEDFTMTQGKSVTTMCMSRELGSFNFAGSGRGGSSGAPAWTRNIPANAGFPLKVITSDGKVGLEVLSVQKGSIPESTFKIPEGYKPMPGMGGMGGGMGGRRGGGGGI